MLDKSSPIAVLGSGGMVGSAIVRNLVNSGWKNILPVTRKEADLTNQSETEAWYYKNKPRYVIMAAARVGGIHANMTYPAEFIYQNLAIATNTIHGAHLCDVEKLLYLGSNCIYPKFAPQPITEESLLTSPFEPTNEAYAIAKIAGLKMCEHYNAQYGRDYFSVMPCNLYGIGDNFHKENSHVIPGIMRRFHDATIANIPKVSCWGTGDTRREFLNVDDLSDSLLFLLENHIGGGHINVGSGTDVTIHELVETITEIVGYTGSIEWDTSKPEGPPRKIMDLSKLHDLGWNHTIDLQTGLSDMYHWFKTNYSDSRL